MSIPQKILFSFLLSAFLFAGVAALVITGVLDYYGSIVNEPSEIPMLVAVFLTLFLIIFLCFNLRQDSTGETRAPAVVDEEKPVIRKHLPEVPFLRNREYETLEELEAVVEESYLAEFSGADIMPEDMITDEIVQLEAVDGLSGSVSLFKPFAFSSGNPELLQGDEEHDDETAVEIFYQQNGIHYINSDAFTHDDMEKLDSDFARLVESVVDKD